MYVCAHLLCCCSCQAAVDEAVSRAEKLAAREAADAQSVHDEDTSAGAENDDGDSSPALPASKAALGALSGQYQEEMEQYHEDTLAFERDMDRLLGGAGKYTVEGGGADAMRKGQQLMKDETKVVSLKPTETEHDRRRHLRRGPW